jgi:ankyrin repeat protein
MLTLDAIQSLSFDELSAYLLENPAEISLPLDDTGGTCLHYAAWGNNIELVKLLVTDLNDDVTKKDSDGCTALHYAAYGALSIVNVLISAGADVNAVDGEGNTALHFAVFMKQKDIIKALLEAGARVDIEAGDGETALDVAIREEDKDILDIMKSKAQ